MARCLNSRTNTGPHEHTKENLRKVWLTEVDSVILPGETVEGRTYAGMSKVYQSARNAKTAMSRIIPAFIRGILGTLIPVALVLLMIAAVASGQNSAIPFTKSQYFSNAGAPLASGRLCTFSAGTNTPLAYYASPTSAVPVNPPLTLDSAGRGSVYLANGVGYKVILYAAGGNASCPNSGTTIWTEDNVMVGNPGTVAPGTGTANRVAKYITSTTIDDGSIQDLYVGESMRIQADNTLSIGSTTDKATGLYVYTAETEVGIFETTQGTATFSLYGTSGVMGYLSASVASGLVVASGQSAVTLDYATATVTPGSTDTHALGTSSLRWNTGNIKGLTAVTVSLSSGTSAGLTLSGAAPTISSGFGTSPSVTGTAAAMRVDVGTGGVATGGVIGMPTAANGWNCTVENLTATLANVGNARTVQTASTTTTVSVENQTISTGAVLVWTASDILAVSCLAY